MDNVKINISKDKIYIRKGLVKKKFLYIWYTFMVILVCLILLNGEEEDILYRYLDFFSRNLYFNLIIEIFLIASFLGLGFLGFHIFLIMYLESIELSSDIKLFSLNYSKEIKYNFLKIIKVYPNYRYNSIRYKGGSLKQTFKDKCTIIFITKNNEEYEWGYSLSYQKGMEIKKLIEDKVKEKME